MKKNKSIYFISIVMILGVITGEIYAQQKMTIEKKKQILKEHVRKSAKKSNGTIIIKGKVCDSKGNLLDNVEVDGYKSKDLGFWDASKDKDISDEVSGHFSFTFKDCSTVGLDFVKKGYRRAHVSAPGKSGLGDTHFPFRMEDTEVVLYKRGKIARLTEYSSTLEYNRGNSGTAIIIDPKHPPRHEEPITQVDNLHNLELLPDHSVFMIPGTKEDGKIDTVQIGELDEHTRDGIYPKKLRLIMKAEKGGFIEVKPKKEIPLAIQMTEAPKEGYKKELVLSAEQLDRMKRMKRNASAGVKAKTWFYFRVGDLYGKGYCERLRSRDRSEHLELDVGLYLQLNGSRNVETKRPAPY